MVHGRTVRLMGNIFEIKIFKVGPSYAEKCIDAAIAEIKRIEALLTTFDPKSQTNQINSNAGIHPVKVDREVFDLDRTIASYF